MTQNEQVCIEPVRKLLRAISLNRATEMDALLDELRPVCEIDRNSEENVFWSRIGSPNLIGIGVKCSVRLMAHALAAGLVFTRINTQEFKSMPEPDRGLLFGSADRLFNWAVGVDVTRWSMHLGIDLEMEHVLHARESDRPDHVLKSLSRTQRSLGERLFWYACAFILLHELAHLKFRHTSTEGYSSIEQEKEADRFAAEWMSDAASAEATGKVAKRLFSLLGIAVALLWGTVSNVFFGQSNSVTHPEGYDRLFQVLDQIVEVGKGEEYQTVWEFVASMLFMHMSAAGYEFDESDAIHMQGDSRDEVNYLIDRISRYKRNK